MRCWRTLFRGVAPKSTGRERFNRAWLERHGVARHRPEDVQATLAELTARSIVDAAARHCPGVADMYVCGGGTRNDDVMARLARLAAPVTVASTSALGIDPEWVESMAFAWLARQAILGLPGNLPDVTGARAARARRDLSSLTRLQTPETKTGPKPRSFDPVRQV